MRAWIRGPENEGKVTFVASILRRLVLNGETLIVDGGCIRGRCEDLASLLATEPLESG